MPLIARLTKKSDAGAKRVVRLFSKCRRARYVKYDASSEYFERFTHTEPVSPLLIRRKFENGVYAAPALALADPGLTRARRLAPRKSRFIRAIKSSLMLFGQTALHSY